jgi:predicted MPP superfamily phosphohydrolase
MPLPMSHVSPLPLDAAVLLLLILLIPAISALVLLSFLGLKVARRQGFLAPSTHLWIERRWVLGITGALLSVYAIAFAYGYFIEAQWVERTETEIRVREPVLGQDRFRIVQICDLHLTRMGRREHRVIEIIREAKPDLIVITGDFGESRDTAAGLSELLGSLEAPCGKYGVTGNNDEELVRRGFPRSAGVQLLRDEAKLIELNGHRLCLVGQDVVPKIPLKEILRGQRADAYTIYLHHKPDAVDELGQIEAGERVDLFLCGHTHGGQVCLPFWGAVVTESKYHKRYERGLHDFRGIPMYVNRGVGTVEGLPVRFLARPEVAVIDLVYR